MRQTKEDLQLTKTPRPNEPSVSTLGAEGAVARLVAYAVGFVASVLIARALGPEGRGAYQLPVTIATVVYCVLNLGLDQAQFRLWSTEVNSRRLLPATGFVLGISLGVLGAGLVFLARLIWTQSLVNEIPLTHMLWGIAALPFMVHGLLLTGLAVLRGDIRRMHLATMTSASVQMALIVLLFIGQALSVEAVLVVWFVTTVIPWMLMLRRARALGPLFRAPINLMRRQLKLGIRYAPYIVFAFLILRVDVLVIAEMMDLRSVGIYSVAVLFPEVVWIFTDSLAYPVAHRQANLPDRDAAEVTFVALRVVIVLVVLAGPVVATAAHWIIPTAYGASFAPASSVVWVLIPGVLGLALWRTLNPYLVRTAAPWVPATIGGASLLVNLILNLVLIPLWGIRGAALASSIAYWFGAALAVRFFLADAAGSPGILIPKAKDVMILWRFGASTCQTIKRSLLDLKKEE